MESDGSIAIKKNMSTILKVLYEGNIITLISSEEEYKLRVIADEINGLDDLFDSCINKTLIKITYKDIPYDDTLHPFESSITYCGGIMEWFTYRSYTFHFDDETCSTIELKYSTPEADYPELIFVEVN